MSVCVCVRAVEVNGWSSINSKLGTHILSGSGLAGVDPEIKRLKVKVTQLRKPSLLCGC